VTASEPDRYLLRLFVAGTSPRSLRTIESLRRLCVARLPDRHRLEVVDIYQQPELAAHDGVLAAPTLVRMAPLPVRKITGDLSSEARVAERLGLQTPEAG
jgi:circadian clock protein KaiB